jgi:hypothetical protein
MKKGAPKRAVKIPTGTSAGIAIVRAQVSANNNNIAPSTIEAGTTAL